MRLKKGKKRFEIACYKNKVLEYRSSIETDLDNVLQIPNVFLSVSKGQTAPTQDLAKAFGPKTGVDEIIQEILMKGEMQVGEKERHAQADRLHNEVVDIVAGKLVDPRSQRVYTAGMIEKALEQLSSQGTQVKQGEPLKTSSASTSTVEREEGKERKKELPRWTGVVTTKSAKSQALEAMKALIAWQPIPLSRARMRLRVTCTTSILKQAVKTSKRDTHEVTEVDGEKASGTVKDRILNYIELVETQSTEAQEWEVVGFVEPGAFKGLSEFIGGETKGKGRVEVLDMAVVHDGD